MAKLLRAYCIVMLMILFVTATVSGMFIVQSNTEKVAAGTQQAVVAAARSEKRLDIGIEDTIISLEFMFTPSEILSVLRLLPYPIGNIISVISDSRALITALFICGLSASLRGVTFSF